MITKSESMPQLLLLPLLALAYLLLGAFGLTLAIPPGYASPLFPAAGLALATLLWFGARALPGIWLGSVLLNLSHSWLVGGLTPAAVVVALVIGSASTLQAWAGSKLVNRWQGAAWRELESEQEAIRFLLLGGVLACLLSATISVTGLHLAGVIERPELLYTWWNWYVGDTLGVLVFAPLTLCLLNSKDQLWRERRRRIVLPMLMTLGVALLAFYGSARWERGEQQNRLQSDGEAIAKRIADRLIIHREVLASLHHFIEATPEFTFKQFQQFTRITLHDNSDIFALSFNDLVHLSQRSVFERKMSGLSPLGPFRITQHDSRKQLVPATERPEYVTVRYIVPLADNQKAVGFDISSEPVRRDAILRARSSKDMAVTSPIKLIQEQKQRIGVLELMPVENSREEGDTARPRLLGFAVAVVKVDELIHIATRDRTPAGLIFQLNDRHSPKDQGLLYRSPSPNSPSSRALTWKTGLRMGDRDWELKVSTTESYLQQHRPWLASAVGGVGLLLATLLQTLMLGITGRTAVIQRQNDALKTSEERYLQLFNDSPLPMWLFETGSRRFLMVNDRAVTHYGWPRERFLEMTREELLPDESSPPSPAGSAECRHIGRDGSVMDVLVRSSAARFGDQEACLEVIQDVTQEKKSRAELLQKDKALLQSEKMASIGQLAAGVAHEINNPMGYISSNLRTLAEYFDQLLRFDHVRQESGQEELSVTTREAVARSREELEIEQILGDGADLITETLDGAVRVTRIVKDLKSFSRVDAPEVEPMALSACLESALTIVQNELKYVATIRKEYAPLPEILCHPGQLNQVFLNLLVNAGQAITPPGEIVLSCWQEEGFVCASVSDSGQGIPEEIRARIFDPFFTTKDVGKGTGLGLSISYEIIKKHGGELLVESVPGTGTTFTVRLPCTGEPAS